MSRPNNHHPSLLPCPWIESLVYESLLNHHLSIATTTKNQNRPKVVQVLAVSPRGSTLLITDGTTSIVARSICGDDDAVTLVPVVNHTTMTTTTSISSRRDIGPGSMIRVQNWDLIISVVTPDGKDDDPPDDNDGDDLCHKYARVVHGRNTSSSSEPKSSSRCMMIYLQFPLDGVIPIGRYSCKPPGTIISPVLETLHVRRAIIHLQQQQVMVSGSSHNGPTTTTSRDRNDVDVVVAAPPAIQRMTAPVGPPPTRTTALPIAPIASLFSTLSSSSSSSDDASFWRYIRTVTPLHHDSDHPHGRTIHDRGDRAVVAQPQLPSRPHQVIPGIQDAGPVRRSASVLPLGNVQMLFGPSSKDHTALLHDICHNSRNPFPHPPAGSEHNAVVPIMAPATMDDPPRADDGNDDAFEVEEDPSSSSATLPPNVHRNSSDDEIGIDHMLIESSDDEEQDKENDDHGGAIELDVHEEDDVDPSRAEPAVATTVEPSTSNCPVEVPPAMVVGHSFALPTAFPEPIPPDINGGGDDNRISENSTEIEKDGTTHDTPVNIPTENNSGLKHIVNQPPAPPQTDHDTRPEAEHDIIVLVDDSDDDIEVLETQQQQCNVDNKYGATHEEGDDDDESEDDDSAGAVILETQCANEVSTSTCAVDHADESDIVDCPLGRGNRVQEDALVSKYIVESFKTAETPPVLLDHADDIHDRENDDDVLATQQQQEEMESVVENIYSDVDESMPSQKKRRAEASATNNIQIGGSDRMSMDVIHNDTENDESNILETQLSELLGEEYSKGAGSTSTIAATSKSGNVTVIGSTKEVQLDDPNYLENKQSKKRRKKAFCFGGDALRSMIS